MTHFHKFPALPHELRLRIWGLAACVPRTIAIWPTHRQSPPNWKYCTKICIPAILHTSQEARSQGLQSYKKLPAIVYRHHNPATANGPSKLPIYKSPSQLYINPKCDRLCLFPDWTRSKASEYEIRDKAQADNYTYTEQNFSCLSIDKTNLFLAICKTMKIERIGFAYHSRLFQNTLESAGCNKWPPPSQFKGCLPRIVSQLIWGTDNFIRDVVFFPGDATFVHHGHMALVTIFDGCRTTHMNSRAKIELSFDDFENRTETYPSPQTFVDWINKLPLPRIQNANAIRKVRGSPVFLRFEIEKSGK